MTDENIINLGIVGIKNMGSYNSETIYEKLNVVTYEGSSYCATKNSRGVVPTNTEYWQLYARKGDTGDTGPRGATGNPGPRGATGNPGSSPLVASSVSEMSDTTRIYVNTTDGHWYYYDGTNWVDGGVYQSTGISPDDPIIKNLDDKIDDIFEEEISILKLENTVSQSNLRVVGVDENNDLIIQNTNGFTLLKINLEDLDKTAIISSNEIYVKEVGGYNHNFISILNSNEKVLYQQPEMSNNTTIGLNINEDNADINIMTLLLNYPTAKYIYLNFKSNTLKFNAKNFIYKTMKIIGFDELSKEKIKEIITTDDNTQNIFNINSENNYIPSNNKDYLLTQNGSVVTRNNQSSFSVSHYMKVKPNHKIFLRWANVRNEIFAQNCYRYCFYDKDYILINTEQNVSEFMSPQNAKYLRICVSNEYLQRNFMVTMDSPLNFYEKYNDFNKLINSFNTNDIYDIVLPTKMLIHKDIEANIIPENCCRYFNPKKCDLIKVDGFTNFYNSFRLTPTENTQNFETYIKIFKDNTKYLTMSKSMQIVNIKSNPTVTKNVMIIGDSLTERGIYPTILKNMFNNDNMSINLVGTRTDLQNNPSEGREGWAISDYCTKSSYNDRTNPFYNNNTFDFTYYMNNNNVSIPDIIIIALGTNDMHRHNYETDAQILSYYQTVINSIHSYNSNIIIALWLAPTQAIANDYTRRINIDNCLQIQKILIDNFDNQENNNIYLIPTYLYLDNDYDYPMTLENVSASNSDYKLNKVNDFIHPSNAGYDKIAKSIYPYLKYFGTDV